MGTNNTLNEELASINANLQTSSDRLVELLEETRIELEGGEFANKRERERHLKLVVESLEEKLKELKEFGVYPSKR